jgi:transcriptional regulator with XRE-family HTH domain
VHVGERLRQRRYTTGMSQQRLAEATGLSFQQIQKYESADNRVSLSRLCHFARFLNVSVGYFFEGLPSTAGDTQARAKTVLEERATRSRETVQLVEAYYRITDRRRRRVVYQFIRAMTGTPPR